MNISFEKNSFFSNLISFFQLNSLFFKLNSFFLIEFIFFNRIFISPHFFCVKMNAKMFKSSKKWLNFMCGQSDQFIKPIFSSSVFALMSSSVITRISRQITVALDGHNLIFVLFRKKMYKFNHNYQIKVKFKSIICGISVRGICFMYKNNQLK